ncbi:MAG: ABC transporter permease [SAR202 cluster bacterium]|jgi:peptide/nickel transport system permease protein|nr:ABC transporter permease [SAR202 cluster bacterium]
MLGYLLRRIGLSLITIWAISIISFVIISLPPGDFASSYIERQIGGPQMVGTPTARLIEKQIREQYGLDQPIFVQYIKWAWKVVHLDFGMSLSYGQPVLKVVGERLLMTVILSGSTAVLAWGLAIPIGIFSALRQHKWEDYTVTFIGFIGLAVPDFLLALLLLWFGFRLFPDHSIGGLFSPEYRVAPWSIARVVDLLSHLWLAAFVVGTAGTAALIRVMRANLLDELRKPYVTTARARGLAEWKVVLKYPVRLALNPLVSTMGYLLPFLMSGSIIVSVVLSLPTEGPLLLKSFLAQDMFTASTILLVLASLTVVGTLISDILLGVLDPRIRYVK